jgi:hypothetical protein
MKYKIGDRVLLRAGWAADVLYSPEEEATILEVYPDYQMYAVAVTPADKHDDGLRELEESQIIKRL